MTAGPISRRGVATFQKLCGTPVATEVRDGPAIALLRPHELRVLPESGPVRIRTVHVSRRMARARVSMGDRVVEALLPEGAPLPTPAYGARQRSSRASISEAPWLIRNPTSPRITIPSITRSIRNRSRPAMISPPIPGPTVMKYSDPMLATQA